MPATDASQAISAESDATPNLAFARFSFATKTALSLTLAYLIPMAMGWSQPQTAAITVMLIAASGMVSDSLQKGVMRVLGTVAGAIIGLALISLFPQDRLAYLLAASLVVTVTSYLYNAYQGDSTLFMLTAVVTLMMFNGGDAQGAFLYGIERAYMTVFGVIVYTVVASTLWPVRAVDNTRALATKVASAYGRAFAQLVAPDQQQVTSRDDELAALLASEDALQTHFTAVKQSAEGVAAYRAEWNTVLGCYEELETLLVPALQQESRLHVDFNDFLANYPLLVERVGDLFSQLERCWQGQPGEAEPTLLPVEYRRDSLRGEPHLTIAAVATRAELLVKIQELLLELHGALQSMLFDRGGFVPGRKPRGKPAFVWLDLENAKTAARAFVTFWIASAIWIAYNPPGGFLFVTLCTVLVPLVSYTPVTPKLLFILLTLGFACALPAYVFLLPQMSHWFELGIFMFGYSFIGFYVFQGPVSIFFLLGLMTLGIQNTMSYQFDAILLLVLTFYLLCALLIVTTHFPFTSKPERIYTSLCRRFFGACARSIGVDYAKPGPGRWWARLQAGNAAFLLAKMHAWGARIDAAYFSANPQREISELNQACDLLQGQLQVLSRRRQEFAGNSLITAARQRAGTNLLVELCDTLAAKPAGALNHPAAGLEGTAFDKVEGRLMALRQSLDALRRDNSAGNYDRQELALFYVYISQQMSILDCIDHCREARQSLDWQQLAETRF